MSVTRSKFVRVAHDPGDPMVATHCPFCGSGQVIGRSDGNIECDFCGQVYLVRVGVRMGVIRGGHAYQATLQYWITLLSDENEVGDAFVRVAIAPPTMTAIIASINTHRPVPMSEPSETGEEVLP